MTHEEWMAWQRQLPKIDTHEHFPPEQFAVGSGTDIFDVLLIPYNCDTMQAAGCTRQEWAALTDKGLPFHERYRILEKYLPFIRYTAFFRAAEKTLKLGFGEETVDEAALRRADAVLQRQLKEPHYDALLDKLNIQTVLCCSGYGGTADYTGQRVRFIPTVSEILPRCRTDAERLESVSGVAIHGLDDLLRAVDTLFAGYAAAGVRAVKFGSAYRRTLGFAVPDRGAAEAQLRGVLEPRLCGDAQNMGYPEPARAYEELTALDDYLTDHMIGLSERYGFAVIFHVAMHAWNDNDPERAHAHDLTGLIRRYSRVRFVLLHTGAPFFEEAVLLARYHPNVYLDLTWFHIISPQLVRQAIVRILELVPTNKVFAFGGDYCYLQTLPGHLETAMENFADVFEKMCEEGVCTRQQAQDILRQWYFENPRRVYGL